MSKWIWRALLAMGWLCALGAAVAAAADDRLAELEARVAALEGKQDKQALDVFWKDGLNFKGEKFSGKIGGRIHLDSFTARRVDDGVEAALKPENFDNGVEFRRVWLETSGEISGSAKIFYKLQIDLSSPDEDTDEAGATSRTGKGAIAMKDVYMGIADVPVVGNVKVGHFKEPFSLEQMTSSSCISFMECSLADVFAPARNVGAAIYDDCLDGMATWTLGVFRDTDDLGYDVGGDYNVTGRVTASPIYANDGRQMLHLGVSGSHRNPDGDTLRYRQRPEAHMAARFVDTGNFVADAVDLCDGEAAVVLGPFSAQAEYMSAMTDSDAKGDPEFSGYYVYGTFFLTGEHRPYKRSEGVFSRVKPKKNLGQDGGIGAVEVGARYSHLDLTDAGVTGGELDDVTLGVNWHLNPNMRVTWNYIWTDVTGGASGADGKAELCMLRFAVDF